MEIVFHTDAITPTGKAYTIKPSLFAFPLTWLWIIPLNLMVISSDAGAFKAEMILMYGLLPLLVLLMVTKGRSYILQGNTLTKVNHLSGDREVISTLNIRKVQIKPRAFGYGSVILTLAGGDTFTIKNIKLPPGKSIKNLMAS